MNSALGNLVVSLVAETAQYTAALNASQVQTTAVMTGISNEVRGMSAAVSSASRVASAAIIAIPFALIASEVMSAGKGVVSFAAQLDDLADSTGSSVEALSKVANQARVSGVDMGTLTPAIGKLAAGMAGVDEESGNVARALKAIGVESRDPAQALQEIAIKLDGYADGVGKAALARDLFGRGGPQFLAMLKDMAKYQDVAATITTKQAAEAEKLEQQMRLLGVQSTAFANIVLSAVVPAISAVIERFNAGTKAGLGFWTALNMAGHADVAGQIQQVGKDIAETNKKITDAETDGRRAYYLEQYKEDLRNLEAKRAALVKIHDAQVVADSAGQYGMGNRSEIAAPMLKYSGGSASTKAAVDEIARALDTLESSLRKSLAAEEQLTEVDKVFQALTEGKIDGIGREHKKRLELILGLAQELDKRKQIEAADKAFLVGMGDIKDALDAEMKIRIANAEVSNRAFDDYFDGEEKKRLAIEASIKSLRESVEQAEFEVRVMTMSDAERVRAIMLREAEKNGIDATTVSFQNLIARMQDASATKATLQSQIDLWHGIEGAAHDAWMHIGDNARDTIQRIEDALKNGVLELLYQMTAKPFILNIGASLTGNGALAAQAAQAGALGNGMSIGGGMFGDLGIFTGGFGGSGGLLGAANGFGGAQTAALDSMLGNMGLESLAGGALTSVLGPVVAALPWAALAAIAVPLVAGLFDDGPANRTADFASGSGLGSGNPAYRSRSKFGAFGLANDSYFSDSEMSGQISAALQTIAGLDNAIAAAVGPEQTAAIAAALSQHSANFGFGTEHTDLNASGAIGGILKDRYSVVLATLDARLSAVFDRFEGTGEEMGKFLVSLVELDKVVDKLPAEIGDKLIGALDGTADAIAHVGALATGLQSVTDLMNRDPAADALEAFAAQSRTAYSAFLDSAEALRTQLDANDASAAGINALTAATNSYYAAQVQLLAQIEQVKASVSSMFEDTIRSLTLQSLDDPAKYAFLQNEADSLRDELGNASDPQRIQELAGRINDDINAAFGLLDPTQQRALLSQYTERVSDLNDYVAQRLGEIRDDTTDSVGDTLREVSDRMKSMADQLTQAGATQVAAANTQLAAANTPQVIRIDTPAANELIPG